ncbi:hypothetical protein KSC_027830 [Ktedonobacter sp. SOSP1-52]|nr:hypothetical protein KSC_027830 [Ktedonobacter sp. SOSP1-52]
MNGLVALLLIFAGYQVMMYRYLDLQEKSLMGSVARILAAAIAANLGFYFILPQLIELCNFISMSFLGWILGRSAGDFTLPLGGINWVEQPVVWAIFILIDFAASICYVFIAMVRLAVLDICIVLAPWWIVLLGNELTRNWGRLGPQPFSQRFWFNHFKSLSLVSAQRSLPISAKSTSMHPISAPTCPTRPSRLVWIALDTRAYLQAPPPSPSF